MTQPHTDDGPVDFGWSVGTLLRTYLTSAREAVADVTGGHRGFQVLAITAGGGCGSQARLADALGIDRTVMTYLLDELETAGLVVRRPDPQDRRARLIDLTPAGRRVHEDAVDRLADVEHTVLGALDADEARVFRALLGRVTGRPEGQHGGSACEVADPGC